MNTAVTQNIKISVSTYYQESSSNPDAAYFVFAYKIMIENQSSFTVKLLRRHWFITDSNLIKREVEGEGVVGQTPTLEPGKYYEYISACNLQTDTGKMYGFYIFERLVDGLEFEVQIPEFTMMVPVRMN